MSSLAILTHASSDLAPPLAAALLHDGMRLALVDADPDESQRPAAALKSDQASHYSTHVNEESIRMTFQAILDHQGTPDVLVTCPAPPTVRPSIELTELDFRAALENNLLHAFLWSKVAAETMMKNGGGVIVHITGLSGLGGWKGWLAQSAAFGGIHQLVHTLAVEWAKSGVRVNALVPGITDSVVQQSGHSSEQLRQRIPMERLATEDDLGAALRYLVSPKASFVTGEILRVDGGWDIWGRLYAVAKR